MLSHVKIIKELDKAGRDELAGLMVKKVLKKNVTLISQGELSRNLFIILTGRLKVFMNDEQGNQTILAFLNDGDYCGELSLLDGRPRSASIVTLTETEVMLLSYEHFKSFIAQHPEAAFPIMRALTATIRKLDDNISMLASQDIYGRLVHVLHKEAIDRNNQIITPRFTHQEIAEMIGSSREMVTRILNDLRKGGYITIKEKRICIERKFPARW